MIRVESERRLDLLRATGMQRGSGGIPGLNRSGPFNGLNYSKHGVTLNLQTDRGKELAKELISRADIVTMNYAAGVAERLGLGYEDLTAIKPDLIMLSGSPLGQTGPEAHSTGWGPTTLAYTMLPYITGYRGGTPSSMGGSYPDFVVGVHMAFAMMSALRHRERTGHGPAHRRRDGRDRRGDDARAAPAVDHARRRPGDARQPRPPAARRRGVPLGRRGPLGRHLRRGRRDVGRAAGRPRRPGVGAATPRSKPSRAGRRATTTSTVS